MMLYLEDENFLSQKDKDFINNVILGNNFPFYYQTHSTKQGDHNSFFCHNLIRRLEDRIEGQDYRSMYAETASKFLLEFCEKNNIKVKEILRAAVNIVYSSPSNESPIHKDHDFDYKHLLIYINDTDKNSKTKIYDVDEKKIIKEVTPIKFKGVCFDGVPHSHAYPKKGSRAVIVFTFR